jgi:UDP-N-acetylglucosamine diphosphorylase/glucosamine-1-phosphate N-acetyltransferase
MTEPTSICIFEDDRITNFFPLTLTRAVFELRCGAWTIMERTRRAFPKAVLYLQCRTELAAVVTERYPGIRVNQTPPPDCLFINGSVLVDDGFVSVVTSSDDTTWSHDDVTVAFWNGLTLKKKPIDCRRARYPWQLIQWNAELIRRDQGEARTPSPVPPGVYMVNSALITIGDNVAIKPGVVLDASGGPILIGNDVTLMAHAAIEGPCVIGDRSVIKMGAKIYGGSTVGPMCKVGGEVEASILQGYSNKQHDGFLGHSYIGEWCNLGADTNTSDLKNNYTSVRVPVNGREIDTGSLFVGLIMGDHSKSGINTMFNTGTSCGVACNVFGSGFPPRDIPSFSWVEGSSVAEHRFDKALDVARTVMRRRNVDLSAAYEQLFQTVFDWTAPHRGDRMPA